MKLSIIIPFYSNKKVLELCLEKLSLKHVNCDYSEIIVVNDNPSQKLILDEKTNLHVITNKKNGGYSSAINFGVENSTGDLLLFIDSDIVPRISAINNLLQFYNEYDDKNMISLSTLIKSSSSDLITHAGVTFYKSDVLKPLRGFKFNALKCENYYVRQALTSGILMLSRKLFEAIGGFNERYFNGYCDIDLSLKINSIGGKNIIVGKDFVGHRGRVSGNIRTSLELETKALFFKEWGSQIIDDHFEYLNDIFRIYKAKFNFNSSYSVFDFSNSLFSDEYIAEIERTIGFKSSNYYKIRYHEENILVEDAISWSLLSQKEPFVFFVDNWMRIRDNIFWFKQRKNKQDLVIDINGRLICTDDFLI